MVKAANVGLIKTIPIGGGLITVLLPGETSAVVKAAVDAGSKAASKVGELVSSHILARPHDDLLKVVFSADKRRTRPSDLKLQPTNLCHNKQLE